MGVYLHGQRTEDTKRKISIALKGKPHPWARGKVPWNKGKPRSDEDRKKISASLPDRHGDKSGNWKGGISLKREYAMVCKNKRRALKLKNGGTYTLLEWEQLKLRYRYMCLCCKKVEPGIVLSADHVIPLARGGRNDIENIQPLCRGCNMRKYTKKVDYRISVKTI